MTDKKTSYLTEEETATMWLMGEEYSGQCLGIKDFWGQLPENRKQLVRDFLSDLANARGEVVTLYAYKTATGA